MEVVQHIIQLFGYQVGLLEGLAALPVQEGKLRRFPDILNLYLDSPIVCCDGAGRFIHDNIAPKTVHLVLGANVGNQTQYVFGHGDLA